jgi:large subunit ribosomal protein LP0
MVKVDKPTWKANYFTKFTKYFGEFSKVMIVGVDNVGSRQMQLIRLALRGHAELLNGKNTMMRKALNLLIDQGREELAVLLPFIKGNVAFVFTDGDLKTVRDLMSQYKVQAPARTGALAPIDVTIDKGPTGLGPEKTSFFQALNITTKIARGLIEIISDVHLVKAGERVGASEAALLNMLNVSPFQYGLELMQVYDNGALFAPEVLDVTEEDILGRFLTSISNVAAVSLAIGHLTVASVPHILANGFKDVLAVAVATDITFPAAEKAKAYIADPSAFAAAAPAASADAPAAAAAAPEPEESESEEDMGFGLFD